MGPMLSVELALAISYNALATQLQDSGFNQLSSEWHQRALNVAMKYDIEESLVDLLQKAMTLASIAGPVHRPSIGSPSANHTKIISSTTGTNSIQPRQANGQVSGTMPAAVVSAVPSRTVLDPLHSKLGGSKSMDDADLSKQLNSMHRHAAHPQPQQGEPHHRPEDWNRRNSRSGQKGDGDSSSISDENEVSLRRGRHDEFTYTPNGIGNYSNPVLSSTNINAAGFNDSFVETVDLTRRHQLGQGERPRSALPRLIHETIIVDTHNNSGGHLNNDGDSLTMESGMISMPRYSAAHHSNHGLEMSFGNNYNGGIGGIDQSTSGLKPVRVQSALSRLGAEYTKPPQTRPDSSREKLLVTNVNVNVRGGDVFPQQGNGGVNGGPSGDYSAELFPPLPSTTPTNSNLISNQLNNHFYQMQGNIQPQQQPQPPSQMKGYVTQYGTQDLSSGFNWPTTYGTSSGFGSSWPVPHSSSEIIAGTPNAWSHYSPSMTMQNSLQHTGQLQQQFGNSTNGLHWSDYSRGLTSTVPGPGGNSPSPEPPSAPYPAMLMPRVAVTHQEPINATPYDAIDHSVVPSTSGEDDPVATRITSTVPFSKPRAGAIVQIPLKSNGSAVTKARKSPNRGQKRFAKKSEYPSVAAVSSMLGGADGQQDSVALTVATTWDKIVHESTKSDAHVKALSNVLQNERSLGVNLEGLIDTGSTENSGLNSSMSPSKVESEMTTKLRELILKARCEEREMLLGEIISEEKIMRLRMFKVGMKVKRFGTSDGTGGLADQSIVIDEHTDIHAEHAHYRVGTIINIRHHLLSFDIRYDEDDNNNSAGSRVESFVSMYSVLPLDSAEGPATSAQGTNDLLASKIIVEGLKASNLSKTSSPRPASSSHNAARPSSRAKVGSGLQVGSAVQRGKIEAIYANGKFDVMFGGGSKERNVTADNIRVLKLAQLKINDLYVRSLVSETENEAIPEGMGPGAIIAGLDFKKAYPWMRSQENSRQLRADAAFDMHNFMKRVRAKAVDIKREEAQKMIAKGSNKVVPLQALVRGFICRRRNPGVIRHLIRFRLLVQKERELALKQKEMENELKRQQQQLQQQQQQQLQQQQQQLQQQQ